MRIPLVSRWVHRWAVTAQQRSRRNAMIASTQLAQRRAERIEVDAFLSAREQRSATRTGVVRGVVGG